MTCYLVLWNDPHKCREYYRHKGWRDSRQLDEEVNLSMRYGSVIDFVDNDEYMAFKANYNAI